MNNLRITIKYAKFSGYHFYINLNIWGDFQIYISVPLTHTIILVFSSFLIFCIHWQIMNSKNIGACLKNPLFSDAAGIETIY